MSASGSPPLGRVVDGRYRIEREVGAGGMGVVYEARQLKVDRTVAIKVLRPERIGDEAAVAQFLEEARAVGRLRSPHTVTLHDAGTMEDGAPYLAMELLEGTTLRARLKQGPVPLDEAVRILDGIALSLAEAHDRGLVHRDLKPANVFLADTPGHLPQVKVLDFGLARLIDGESSGRAAGTLLYMAPEALRGEAVDARADVYALGMVAHELLAGAHPFRELDRDALIEAQLAEVPPSLDESEDLEEAPPDDLVALVARSLGKPKRLRPKDAAAFRVALRAACDLPEEVPRARSSQASAASMPTVDETIASETVVSRTLPQPTAAELPPARTKRAWLVAVAVVVVVLGALGALRGPGEVEGEAEGEVTGENPPRASAEEPDRVPSVEVIVQSDPAGAEVRVDGSPVGTTPATLELERERAVELEVALEGHTPHRQMLRPKRDRTLVLQLAAEPAATAEPEAEPRPTRPRAAMPRPAPTPSPPEPTMADRVHDYLD